MASQGLSSWLGNPQTDTSDSQQQQNTNGDCTDSPLDISLAQLRAKETITRISPEKRSLVEEIDSEADDAEFDERAHWARKVSRKKARASRKAARAADTSQPSIALFCVKAAISVGNIQETDAEDIALANAILVSQLETISAEQSEKKASKRGNKKKNSSGLEFDSAPNKDKVDDRSDTVTCSGRPKRQAVVRAEILQQQQKLLDAVAARKNAASFLTPPPSKKATTDANATTSGRKRKLEMNKKKASPPVKNGPASTSPGSTKAATSFFLSEQERKQLQELEAVSTFREHLRQTREKDLAFFSGKTANPFFQTKAIIKRSSSVENEDGVIDIDGNGQAKSRRGTGGGRWNKPLTFFPGIQHVLTNCIETEDLDTDMNSFMPLKKTRSDEDTAVVVIEDEYTGDNELSNKVLDQLKAALNGQVTTESSFSEQFWFSEFLNNSSIPTPVSVTIDVSSPHPVVSSDEAAADLAVRETLLIDELVDMHGMREKRVRELLEGLERAKAKRVDREQNLSLVDRYLPVNASGLVGNDESLHTLSSWLSAWKVGGGDRERLNCFESELFTIEDGDSDNDDEIGALCRLFILEGESSSGKSAAIYACAEDLGYEIIEINAAQNRSGKSIMELAGEATQSTRVLHVGSKDDKKKKKQKKRRRHSESRKSLEKSTAASLSLVLFEDVDLVFEEDKGFLNAVCSIAKHSKCPIVVTCAQLPDVFPAKPGRLCRELHRPSMDEFATWMRLVAFIEGIQLAPSLIEVLGKFFLCDVRRSLHFLEANLPVSDINTKTQWCWQHVSAETEEKETRHVDIPAWTIWSSGCSSFDALSTNLLVELSAVAEVEDQKPEEKNCEEKQADFDAMAELAQIMDTASIADTWIVPEESTYNGKFDYEDVEDSYFLSERKQMAALELRRCSLHMLESSTNPLGVLLKRGQGTSASICVQRTLDSSLAASRRRAHQTALADLKPKFELPLAYKGCGNSEPQFVLDYMPMVGRLLSSTGLQEGRRRTSRRNHYLGDVLGDMSLIDELPAFDTYTQTDEDQIIAASPSSTQ